MNLGADTGMRAGGGVGAGRDAGVGSGIEAGEEARGPVWVRGRPLFAGPEWEVLDRALLWMLGPPAAFAGLMAELDRLDSPAVSAAAFCALGAALLGLAAWRGARTFARVWRGEQGVFACAFLAVMTALLGSGVGKRAVQRTPGSVAELEGRAQDAYDRGRAGGFRPEGARPLPAGQWTNEPPGAAGHARWEAYGVSADSFHMAAGAWSFPVRGVPVEGVHVSANGTLGLDRGPGRAVADNTLRVLGGPAGLVPQMGGRFWWHATASNTVVFTHAGVFLMRDPAYPAALQTELFPSGDWAFRYALLDPLADYSGILTNFTVGSVLGGVANEWPLGGGGGGDGGRGQGDGGEGGEGPPPILGILLANPGGVEIRFEGPGDPRPAIDPTNVCFHSMSPHTFTLTGTNGFDGVVTWQYGGQRFEGNPLRLVPDFVGKTNALEVTFTVGGRTFTTNAAPLWYCTATPTNAPAGGGAPEGGYCHTCCVWRTDTNGCPHVEGEEGLPGGGGGGTGEPEPFASYKERGLVPEYCVRLVPIKERLVRFYPHGGPGGGMCCPCPAHAAHHASPATLIRLTSHIKLYVQDASGGLQPLAVGGEVPAGQAVYVAGDVACGSRPWVARAVFEWTEGNETVAQTNAFTTMGVDLLADFDRDGSVGTNDIIRSVRLSPPGLPVPAQDLINTRRVELDAFVRLGGDFVLSLEAVGASVPWHTNVSQRVRVLNPDGSVLLVPGQAATNNLPGHVIVEALAPGEARLDYAFHGNAAASNLTCSASLPVTSVGIECEPVSIEADPGASLYNPCGVPLGGTAAFKLRVLPESFPDGMVTWADSMGRVSFPAGNTGREVTAQGVAAGDFWLSAQIEGATSASWNPYILGKVLAPTTNQLHFYVICDASGAPSVTEDTIDAWVAEANRIYRQAAMTFVKASVTRVERPDWLNITSYYQLFQMFRHAKETGGLEVYCVSSLFGGRASGINLAGGMAVEAGAKKFVLAHEIGHACGLSDIAELFLGYGRITQESAGWLNWGGGGGGTGYYPRALTHRAFVRRLLMYYSIDRDDAAVAIPLGDIMGNTVNFNGPENELGSIRVGLDAMDRNPRHK